MWTASAKTNTANRAGPAGRGRQSGGLSAGFSPKAASDRGGTLRDRQDSAGQRSAATAGGMRGRCRGPRPTIFPDLPAAACRQGAAGTPPLRVTSARRAPFDTRRRGRPAEEIDVSGYNSFRRHGVRSDQAIGLQTPARRRSGVGHSERRVQMGEARRRLARQRASNARSIGLTRLVAAQRVNGSPQAIRVAPAHGAARADARGPRPPLDAAMIGRHCRQVFPAAPADGVFDDLLELLEHSGRCRGGSSLSASPQDIGFAYAS